LKAEAHDYSNGRSISESVGQAEQTALVGRRGYVFERGGA